jgi:enoyl-CoA hydratase/carnithine racemase
VGASSSPGRSGEENHVPGGGELIGLRSGEGGHPSGLVAFVLTWQADLMAYELLTLERRDDGVAVVTLANGKVNPLSRELLAELRAAADELATDLPGAVVITGGERIFAAGADIAQFGGPDEAAEIGPLFHDAIGAFAALPRFVIAAVSGYALGGGCELALGCDYRIASERAVFGQPEILLGIIPGGGGTQRLARIVGPSRAKEICITGRQVKAEEALRIGLVDEVVPAEELHDRALALAGEVANGALVAQGITKRLIDEGLSTSLSDGLALERDGFVDVFRTEDSQIGVRSFLEHGPGKAEFTGA